MAEVRYKYIAEAIVKGVQTNDATLKSRVFKKRKSEEEIVGIITELPEAILIPFIKYLGSNRPLILDCFPDHAAWAYSTLLHHWRYFKRIESVEQEALLEPLRPNPQRVAALPTLLEMKARLEHFARKKEIFDEAAKAAANNTPSARKTGLVFNFRDETSDEEDEMAVASTVGASESDDNWDELSEMGYGSSGDDDDDPTQPGMSTSTCSSSYRGFAAECEIVDVEDSESEELEGESELDSESSLSEDEHPQHLTDSDQDHHDSEDSDE